MPFAEGKVPRQRFGGDFGLFGCPYSMILETNVTEEHFGNWVEKHL